MKSHLTNTEELALYETALTAILSGAQEYRIGTRLVRRADLAAIQSRIDYLRGQIAGDTYGTTAYARWPGR